MSVSYRLGIEVLAPCGISKSHLERGTFVLSSERQQVEQLDYNLLFRWCVGLGMDDAVWNHAVFSKNRDRLLTSEVAQAFFAAVTAQAKRFMSDEHFTVDGTLIQAWASQKSFKKKDGADTDGTNFHRGTEAKLAFLGHALVENRNGLIVRAMVTQADGYAEREAAR